MPSQTAHLVGSLTPIAVIVLILAVRLPRMLKGRRLRLETLWIRPALLLALGGVTVAAAPPRTLLDIAISLAGLALGAAIGWRQGKMMTISVAPESHQLNVKASPVAVLLFVGLLALRFGLRMVLTEQASAWHLNISLVVDTLMALLVGLYVAQSIEMYLRASAMLREAKAGDGRVG